MFNVFHLIASLCADTYSFQAVIVTFVIHLDTMKTLFYFSDIGIMPGKCYNMKPIWIYRGS